MIGWTYDLTHCKQRRKLPAGKPFQKGQSGNPSGRPKALKEVVELARSYTITAIEALAQIAVKASAPESPACPQPMPLLDRPWGKPKDTVAFENAEGG